jgi:hypothetical protein
MGSRTGMPDVEKRKFLTQENKVILSNINYEQTPYYECLVVYYGITIHFILLSGNTFD